MAYHCGPHVVTRGLKFLVDAQDKTSYTADTSHWYDLSGNNYDASINVALYSSTQDGIYFNSASAYVTLPPAFNTYATNFTWNAWVYPTSGSTDNTFMYRGGTNDDRFTVVNGVTPAFGIYIGGTYRTGIASPVTINRWYYHSLTVTYDTVNTTIKIYTNGIQTFSGTWAGAAATTNGTFYLGWDSWAPTRRLTGYLGSVSIYDVTLLESEIRQNYLAHKARYYNP